MCPRWRACSASKPTKQRWPVASVLTPRDDRSRSRVGPWLRSIGFVVSPRATGHGPGATRCGRTAPRGRPPGRRRGTAGAGHSQYRFSSPRLRKKNTSSANQVVPGRRRCLRTSAAKSGPQVYTQRSTVRGETSIPRSASRTITLVPESGCARDQRPAITAASAGPRYPQSAVAEAAVNVRRHALQRRRWRPARSRPCRVGVAWWQVGTRAWAGDSTNTRRRERSSVASTPGASGGRDRGRPGLRGPLVRRALLPASRNPRAPSGPASAKSTRTTARSPFRFGGPLRRLTAAHEGKIVLVVHAAGRPRRRQRFRRRARLDVEARRRTAVRQRSGRRGRRARIPTAGGSGSAGRARA